MKFIGLLMVSDENDILPDTLAHNSRWCDAVYSLSPMDDRAAPIIAEVADCAVEIEYDECLPADYPMPVRDGARQRLLEYAYADHGQDNWFLLLHGDEYWVEDPRDLPREFPEADGFMFRLPLYFPRAGEEWDYDRTAFEQLRWHLGPGTPEFRMFKGGPNVKYNPAQHFNVEPGGLKRVLLTDRAIRHYNYRSPEVQRARAKRHQETGFDPDNYQHILSRDEVYWTDKMINKAMVARHYRYLYSPNPTNGLMQLTTKVAFS